jgi:hypothetical protein
MKDSIPNQILHDILGKIQMTEIQQSQMLYLLKGELTYPCLFMDIKEVALLGKQLKEFGLDNIFNMGKNAYEVTWWLKENSIENYLIKKRTETINNIINF